jgi:hypothetical protein
MSDIGWGLSVVAEPNGVQADGRGQRCAQGRCAFRSRSTCLLIRSSGNDELAPTFSIWNVTMVFPVRTTVICSFRSWGLLREGDDLADTHGFVPDLWALFRLDRRFELTGPGVAFRSGRSPVPA